MVTAMSLLRRNIVYPTTGLLRYCDYVLIVMVAIFCCIAAVLFAKTMTSSPSWIIGLRDGDSLNEKPKLRSAAHPPSSLSPLQRFDLQSVLGGLEDAAPRKRR